MNKSSLLDCTLRDGGYVNKWNFGSEAITNIISKLIDSGIEYVETGFLKDCEYNSNYTIYNNCKQIEAILPKEHKNAIFTAMTMNGSYNVDKLEKYDGNTIEIIRVTFHQNDIVEGIDFLQRIQEKGYKVCCNPINLLGYSKEKIIQLVEKINTINPWIGHTK